MDAAKIERMRVMNGALACFGSDYYETQENLKKAGWTKLGSGNYGSAWESRQGGDYVLKVCGRVSGDSYPAWAVFCEANPMPGLPETEFCTFNQEREQFMCMMPRYEEITNELHQEGHKQDLYNELYGIMECNWMGGHKWDATTNSYVVHTPGPRPEVAAAILAREFFGSLVDWDFHRGNAMWDSTKGLLIITDPIHQGNNDILIHKVRTGSENISDHCQQLVRQDRLALENGHGQRAIPAGLHRGEVQMVAAGQAQVKLDGGQGFRFELPKIRKDRKSIQQLAQELRRFRMPTQLRNADFAMLEERVLQQQANLQQIPKGAGHKLEGDMRAAADWVRAHGLSKEKVQAMIPNMKDALVKFHDRTSFVMCEPMAPARWAAAPMDADGFPPLRNFHVPMPVARALVHQANKEFRMACQFGANPDRFMWPPAGMRI